MHLAVYEADEASGGSAGPEDKKTDQNTKIVHLDEDPRKFLSIGVADSVLSATLSVLSLATCTWQFASRPTRQVVDRPAPKTKKTTKTSKRCIWMKTRAYFCLSALPIPFYPLPLSVLSLATCTWQFASRPTRQVKDRPAPKAKKTTKTSKRCIWMKTRANFCRSALPIPFYRLPSPFCHSPRALGSLQAGRQGKWWIGRPPRQKKRPKHQNDASG